MCIFYFWIFFWVCVLFSNFIEIQEFCFSFVNIIELCVQSNGRKKNKCDISIIFKPSANQL